MSKSAFVWLDAGVSATHWAPLPADSAAIPARLAVAGTQAGPDAVNWARTAGVASLVVLARAEDLSAARYVANMVGGALPTLRVAVQVSAVGVMPSLALAARALRLGVGPVATLAAFHATTRTALSGVWLQSVAKLKDPPPRFPQYLRSLLPSGQGFTVLFAPDGAVHSGAAPAAVDAVRATGRLLVAIDAGADVPPALRASFPAAQVVPVASVIDSRAVYGSRGAEFLLDGPAAMPGPSTGASCPTCDEELFTRACPFCHAVAVREGILR